MAHPDEKSLPGYIAHLLTIGAVKDLADFLERHHPDSFKRLRGDLAKRYRELKGSPE